VSRLSSVAAVALLAAPKPLCAEAVPEDAAGAADVAGVDDGTAAAPAIAPAMAPDSAPASAFSSSVRAADTGSVAEGFAADSFGSPVLAVVPPTAVALSADAALAAGAAASDCASAAEKSSSLVADCAVESAAEP